MAAMAGAMVAMEVTAMVMDIAMVATAAVTSTEAMVMASKRRLVTNDQNVTIKIWYKCKR